MQACPKLPVDQPGHRPHAWSVVLTMMAIDLTQTLIPAHASNRVLHHNPPSREGPIESDSSGGRSFPRGFRRGVAPKRCGCASECQYRPGCRCPRLPQASARATPTLSDGDVGRRSQHAVGHITDFARLLVNGKLTFERMLLFLAAVVCIGVHPLLAALTRCSRCRSITASFRMSRPAAHRASCGVCGPDRAYASCPCQQLRAAAAGERGRARRYCR